MEKALEEIRGLVADLEGKAVAKVEELGKATGKSVEEINAKLAEVKGEFSAKLADIEKRMADKRIPGLGEELKKQSFSFHKAFKGIRWNDWSEAGFEKDVIGEAAKQRSNNATDGTQGGLLVPEEVSSEIIQLAIARMPIYAFGPTMLNGLVGNLSLPKVTGRPTGYWVGENSVPTETEAAFGERKLDPKRVAGFCKVSDRLVRQTGGVAETVIRDELVKAISLAVHQACISGSGSENQPKGITGYADLTATTAIGTNGGRLTIDKVAAMIENIEEADMLNDTGRFGLLVRPVVKGGLKRERIAQFSGDTAGAYVFNPLVSDKSLQDMIGYPIAATTQISKTLVKGGSTSCSHAIFGDWSQLVIAMWAGMELKVSDTAGYSTNSAFLQNQMWLVAQQEMDITVKDEKGFTVLSDVETDTTKW